MTCPLAPSHVDGHCDWCGKKLTGKRTRWCSTKCNKNYLMNHRWTQARAEARRRAKVRGKRLWRCAAHPGCTTDRPEANHILPILGLHNTIGCHHHQTGVEILCHKHHLAATAAQRKAGLLTRSRTEGS